MRGRKPGGFWILYTIIVSRIEPTGGPKYPFTRIWACTMRDVLVSRGYTAL